MVDGAHPFRDRLVTTAAVVGLAVTAGCSRERALDTDAISEHTANLVSATPEEYSDYSFDMAAPGDALKTVQKLLDQPGNPLFQSPSVEYSEELEQKRQAQKFAIAENLGIRIINTTPALETLDANLSQQSEHEKPVTFYLRIGNRALRPFGITISLGKQDDPLYRHGAEEPDLRHKDVRQDARIAITAAVGAYDDLPVSLVKGSGLQRIVLYQGPKDPEFRGYAVTRTTEPAIYADIAYAADPTLYRHETFHHVNTVLPGGYFVDPYFESFNKGRDVYTGEMRDDERPNYYTYAAENFDEKKQQAIDFGDKQTYCEIDQQEKEYGAEVQFVSSYHPDVNEDRTEIGELVLDPSEYKRLQNPHLPRVEGKAETVFARIYHYDPLSTQYLIATSSRPTSRQPLVDCSGIQDEKQ